MRIIACLVVVALCLLGFAQASYETNFDDFVSKYEKEYATAAEMEQRREAFETNVKMIAAHNADPANTYELGMNQFGDLSAKEFSIRMKSRSAGIKAAATACSFLEVSQGAPLANNTFDWRATDNMPPVQNEGECGSVSYIVVANQVSAMLSIDTKTAPQVLSAQQMMDCAVGPNDSGCDGGDPWGLYEYVQKKGLETNASYPYSGVNHPKCHYKKASVVAYISGTSNITTGEAEMQVAVKTTGPVAVLFDASELQFYAGGVYSGKDGCSQTEPDHVLLLAGYSVNEKQVPFWIAQNVWGEDWGINGYLYVQMGQNVCGIAQCGTFITGAHA